MELTWQLVVLFLGAATTFLSFIYAMLGNKIKKQPEDWREGHNILKEQIISLKLELENVKKTISSTDEKTVRALEKFENKMEKFTDIIIEHIKKD